MRARFASVLLALAAAAPAQANDSSAALGADGLVLVGNADVRMAEEELFVSPLEIRVRYVFVNESAADAETTVAFPLPDVDLEALVEVPVGRTTGDPVNFVGFEVRSGGVPVAASLERRAVRDGRDVTALVAAEGVPLGFFDPGFYDALAALPPDARARLVDAGLVVYDGSWVQARWTLETKFYWQQRFPAGRPVRLEQRYAPVAGQSFFTEYDLEDPDESYWFRNFCIDAATHAAIARRFRERKAADPEWFGMLVAHTAEYVLTTGNNWKGPIGRFRLVLDKVKPQNILSLCWDHPLRKAGPTTFVSEIADFAPERDLKILVLE